MSLDPILDAIDRAPPGQPFTAEEEAELAADLAAIEAGHAQLVADDDVPAALEAIGREHAA